MAVYRHICEVCGLTEDLTSEVGFNAGWDYPPRMGAFGVVSPRTCPDCSIDKTLWWRLQGGVTADELTPADLELIARIQAEPASIEVSN